MRLVRIEVWITPGRIGRRARLTERGRSCKGEIKFLDFGAAGGADGLYGAEGLYGADGLYGAEGLYGADGLCDAEGLYGADGLCGADGFGADGLCGAEGLYGADGLCGADGFGAEFCLMSFVTPVFPVWLPG
ncbi:hypothetical protein X777_01556 [Ooceraea biroi]|uniref:Uncharacterized protein n=1 Tax=Ooceraea biroi TaxID=2015173 RepID=A0A026WQ74_OOCBI|nr:hypothetical protein X777_01556 [Ooceraea biroi]